MVVGDELELLNLFRQLEGSGFNYVSFTDPLQALKYLINNPWNNNLVSTNFDNTSTP
jgi:hypothetical protein